MATIIASVVSAALTGLITLAVTLINSRAQQKIYLSELEKQTALQEQRLGQLEKKVDQHNHLDRRIVALEEQVKTIFNTMRG